ncbi:MAG: thioredoxin domain-containing protein [Bryobacteraceae bacterium]|nr:thioredoxin domain-containing protein [Bryobacteraceae bacterium]
MSRFFPFALLLVSLAGSAFGQTKKASALDKATMEAYIRHQFMLPVGLKVIVSDPLPSPLPEMSLVNVTVTDGGATNQQVPFYVSKDGSKIVQGKVFDVRQSPFADDLKLLKVDGSPSAGPATAPVTIYVFSDFQCGYCREEAKVLRTNLGAAYARQVRLVFKDFPLEQIHNWARPASIAGRCIQNMKPDAFWRYHDWVFEQQPNLTAANLREKVMEFANTSGVDVLQLGQCFDTKATDKEVGVTVDQARALQVNSTPTMFVNGRRLQGNLPWEQLKGVIDYELDYARKNPQMAAARDEACCEVKLPIPGVK